MIGGFGGSIAAETGWGQSLVYGGFSAALLMMGLSSPLIGKLIDRHGGRRVMAAGSLCASAGCLMLAAAHDLTLYYAAWLVLGLAMRLTLYEAAFATLARIGGPLARRPISQITLLGGLASTTFWPIGHALENAFGWRGALFVYAGLALLTLPLHLAIPDRRHTSVPRAPAPTPASPAPSPAPASPSVIPATATPPATTPLAATPLAATPLAATPRDRTVAGGLYAVIAMLVNFLNAGMSAHMISVLAGLGLATGLAVWISALRGVGQSSARLCEMLFGNRVHPLDLNLGATALLPVCFLAGLFSGQHAVAAIGFAFLYGAGNGIATITRGTLPLVLFDHTRYGAVTGKLLVPSFLLAAAAPLIYALVIERAGEATALYLSLLLAAATFGAAFILRRRFMPKPAG